MSKAFCIILFICFVFVAWESTYTIWEGDNGYELWYATDMTKEECAGDCTAGKLYRVFLGYRYLVNDNSYQWTSLIQ